MISLFHHCPPTPYLPGALLVGSYFAERVRTQVDDSKDHVLLLNSSALGQLTGL